MTILVCVISGSRDWMTAYPTRPRFKSARPNPAIRIVVENGGVPNATTPVGINNTTETNRRSM
jgi:hypothetical protein